MESKHNSLVIVHAGCSCIDAVADKYLFISKTRKRIEECLSQGDPVYFLAYLEQKLADLSNIPIFTGIDINKINFISPSGTVRLFEYLNVQNQINKLVSLLEPKKEIMKIEMGGINGTICLNTVYKALKANGFSAEINDAISRNVIKCGSTPQEFK